MEERKKLLDWIFTPLFLPCFLANLVLFELLFRISKVGGRALYQSFFKGINHGVVVCLKVFAGLRYRVFGGLSKVHSSERKSLPILVIANHQSMFDIPFLCLALPELKLRFVAKKQLTQSIPGISIALLNGEHAIIDRKDPRQAMPELVRAAKLAKQQGNAIAIFPEGTRSRDGKLSSFKVGGIAKVLDAFEEAWVVPVAIDGSWKITRYGLKPVSFGNAVSVHITDVLHYKAGDDVAGLVEQCRALIAKAIKATNPNN